MNLNKILQKVGNSYTLDVCKLESKPLSYIEDIDGINQHTVIKRTYSQSKDGKNWDLYKDIHYGWIDKLEIGNFVRVRFELIKNLLEKPIVINGFQILQQAEQKVFNQGESFLLSGANSLPDFSKMSESMMKVEIDMNYYVNASSPIIVNYWHTNPDEDSTDRFLNEYSLHNVVANKQIRCVVKNNEIPEPKHEFSQWGIEFEKLEIYFEKSYFEEVFGIDEKPRQNDYMYFKEINRMYYITDCYLDRGINENGTFYICVIKKYEDMTNVAKDDDDLNFLKENLPLDDYIEDDLNEMEDMTNERQNLDKDIIYDNVKKFTHKKLQFVRDYLLNNGNDLGDTYYDMNFTTRSIPAISYNQKVHIGNDDGMSFMFWIRISENRKPIDIFKLIDENYEEIKIGYYSDRFKITNTRTEQDEDIIIDIPLGKWICCVIGINNQFSYCSVDLYSINEKTLKTTALRHIDSKEKYFKLRKQGMLKDTPYKMIIDESEVSLLSGNYQIRMIRISNYYIEQQHHSYIMGLKNVKKPSAFFVIDDCKENLNVYKVGKSVFPHLDKQFTEKGNTENYEQ